MPSKALDRIDRWLTALALCVTVPVLIAITVVVLIAVLYRYVLSAPIIYSFDLSTLLFSWMVFIGLIVGERDGTHLNLDILGFALTPRVERWIVFVRHLFAAVLCIFVAWVGYKLASRTAIEIPSMRISQKWLYAGMPIGFAMLGVVYCLKTITAFGVAISREAE
jgi:TRAP-type C4-dicarboxylate transport system permease small subunit